MKLVIVLDQTQQDIGPAGGLIAAHHSCPSATWLVVACDFPFLESGTVKQLLDEFETPVTCFRNSEGFSEPLLAIWSPQALVELEKNVESGRKGPNFTVRMLSGKSIIPKKEKWLTNINTMEEWKDAKSRLEA